MNDELRKALARPVPDEKVKQKRGQGGRTMSYVSHGIITERLNEADPGWSSRVLSEHTYTDANGRLHCEGVTIELTVGGVSRVEAGGPQRQDGFANEIKNAYSDALKRAAMRFGVALSMWESLVDAEYDEDAHPDDEGQHDTAPTGTAPQSPARSGGSRSGAASPSPPQSSPPERPAPAPHSAGAGSPSQQTAEELAEAIAEAIAAARNLAQLARIQTRLHERATAGDLSREQADSLARSLAERQSGMAALAGRRQAAADQGA